MTQFLGAAAFVIVVCGISWLIVRADQTDSAADLRWWENFMRSINPDWRP